MISDIDFAPPGDIEYEPVTPKRGRVNLSKYLPTYKWWAATATSIGTIVIMFWTAGGVNTDDKKIILVGLVVQRVVAYITSNEKTPTEPANG